MMNIKSKEAIFNYTPPILQEDGVATKFKQLNEIYAEAIEFTEDNADYYGNIQDLEHNTGVYLDATCKLYSVFRNDGETDDELRARAHSNTVTDVADCSVVALNSAVKALVGPNVYVVENPRGVPASIAMLGATTIDDYHKGVDTLNASRAAGIFIVESYYVATGNTWGDMNTNFADWQEVSEINW